MIGVAGCCHDQSMATRRRLSSTLHHMVPHRASRRHCIAPRNAAASGSAAEPLSLLNKVAVVTGVAPGTMGDGIASVLLSRGCSICVADHPLRAGEMRQAAAQLRKQAPSGARVESYPADCSDEAALAELFDHATATLGSVDIAVPAAGGAGVMANGDLNMESKGPNSEPVYEEAWAKTMRILNGTQITAYLTARAAAKAMVGHGRGGSIVLIGSIMANSAAVGTAPYTISKAAIRKLGEVMAHEMARHGVRVNTVEPGHISTHFERLAYDEETLAKAAANIPQGRLGTPEDIGRVVAFFCGEDAGYVTGQTITVDGGLRLV